MEVAMSEREITVTTTDFKAKCLDVLRRVENGKLTRVTVTKRGKPVAVLERADAPKKPYKSAYGFMRDRIRLSADYDPFEQVIFESADPFIGKI
jgi:prevent-host-death family protein